MKVKELIKFLKTQKQDALVCLSCDEEGNNYSPLANNYFVQLGNFEEDAKDEMSKYDNWSIDEEDKKGDYIILFPKY